MSMIPSGDSLPVALVLPKIVDDDDGAVMPAVLVEMVMVGRVIEIRAYNAETGVLNTREAFDNAETASEAWGEILGTRLKAAKFFKKHDQIYKDLSDWEFVDRSSAKVDEHPAVVRDRSFAVRGRAGGDDPRPRHGEKRMAPPRSSRDSRRNSRASRRRRQRSYRELVSFLALSGAVCALTLLAAFFVWEVSLALIGNPHRAVGLSLGVVGAMWFGWRWMK